MRVRPIVLGLLFLAFCSGVAQARDPDLPKPDPKGVWRYVWDGHSTSTCLGNPKTPVCAIETLIVCGYRGDQKLCETSDYPAPVDRLAYTFALYPRRLTIHLRFRITGSTRLRAVDMVPQTDSVGSWEQAGDLAIEVVSEECWSIFDDERHCRKYSYTGTEVWIARRLAKRWAVVSVASDTHHTPAPYLNLIHRK